MWNVKLLLCETPHENYVASIDLALFDISKANA